VIKPLGINNSRKFPRFVPQSDLFVLHSNFGKIVNIGMGGMLFTYVGNGHSTNNHPEKGTLFSKDDDYLVELPFKTLMDTKCYHSSTGSMNIRERVVVFEDLLADQVEKLEQLILDNVHVPIQSIAIMPFTE
jgi:hypothetical protein